MTLKHNFFKYIALILVAVMILTCLHLDTYATGEGGDASFETLKFDFGAGGTEPGYMAVSASEAYSQAKGYGFQNTKSVQNVSSSGSGVLSDAVQFLDGDGRAFNVDLPEGVYKITVTTGDVVTTTIEAEGVSQLFFLAGNNAVDSFTIPVTDGQLNIQACSGAGGFYSLSALEIEQVSTGTTTKPTIWLLGDTTVASNYNVSQDDPRGWGQYLYKYVDTTQYDIRNISGPEAIGEAACNYYFETAEKYGKSDDIVLISIAYEEYMEWYSEDTASSDSTEYITWVKEIIRRSKELGMIVYLVKPAGELSDCSVYPLIEEKWFSDETEALASSENVGVIDLFHPWLVFCLENTSSIAGKYYANDVDLNGYGADILASMVSEQLFPYKTQVSGSSSITVDTNTNFDNASTVVYVTEESGEPVANPHKGFIMSVDDPYLFSSGYEYGINGSNNNQAWKLTTICSGAPRWEDLNPAEGVYDWTEIDEMLEKCEEYGMTYGIRIMPYSSYNGDHKDNYGEEHDFVPDWIYKKGAEKVRVKLDSDPSVEIDVPKWDDPIYLQACKDFAAALAEQYDGDPRVEFIDIRTFGDWGEWHFAASSESKMPSIEKQIEIIDYYDEVFDETLLCITSDAYGEVYEHALSLGITKRDDGLIATPNIEWGLRKAYEANLPTLGENYLPYHWMYRPDLYGTGPVQNYDNNMVRWSPERFCETIEIAHLSMFQLDQDSSCGYVIYNEQKDVVEKMCNRLGYNFTVTSAKRNGSTLQVTIKNTGLAPAFFDIDLCAEITDSNGNKIGQFGNPIRIEKGTFKDDMEQIFVFEYDGTLSADTTICLAMYESDKSKASGGNPNVKFDNKNTLSNNRLKLVKESGGQGKEKYVAGYSLDIKKGDFFFNIYTSLPASSKDYIVRIELPDGTVTNNKVALAKTVSQGGTNYQVFTTNITAKDMFSPVVISLYNDKGASIGEPVNVSIYEYAVALKARNSTYADFIDAMLTYGAWAQNYFYNINSSSLLTMYTASDYSSIAGKINSSSGITTDGYIGTSLLLKNQVVLRHYFSKPVQGAIKVGEYYILEKAFSPTEFNKTIAGYDYTVNDYIKKVLSTSSDTSLKNLVTALYKYEEAARKL